jgi:hypothetical protein
MLTSSITIPAELIGTVSSVKRIVVWDEFAVKEAENCWYAIFVAVEPVCETVSESSTEEPITSTFAVWLPVSSGLLA